MMEGVQALLFDVFGTVVDWRTTVSEYLYTSSNTTLSSSVTSLPSQTRARASTLTRTDWARFAQEWRESYFQFTRSYNPTDHGGKFFSIDEFHVQALGDLLEKWNLKGFWDQGQIEEVAKIWHRLTPWPDSVKGLSILRERFDHLVTLSNGNTELLRDLARFGSLGFTDLFSAQDFGLYKPRREVYEGAAERLGLLTGQCAMVAAHLGDLKAARDTGMKTVYVERDREEGWDEEDVEKAKQEGWVDVWVGMDEGAEVMNQGFLKLAGLLAGQ